MARLWREASTLIIATKSTSSKAIEFPLQRPDLLRVKGRIPDHQHFKLLMLKRAKSMGFMANAYVFPGGLVDKADFSSKWWDIFKRHSSVNDSKLTDKIATPSPGILQASHYKWVDPDIENGINSGKYLPPDLALRLTAIRETFEECGILIAKSNKAPLSADPAVLNVDNLAEWQARIQKDANEMMKLCLDLDCVPDIWALNPWSNWLTPAFRKPRFDSIFFICTLNTKPEVNYSSEVSNHLWCSPYEYLMKSGLREMFLPPPQVYELGRLMNFEQLSDVGEFAKARFNKSMHLMMPIEVTADNGFLHLLPGDQLYPETPDFLGHGPPLKIDGTIKNLDSSSHDINRMTMDNDSYWTLKCNVDLDSGHKKPVSMEGVLTLITV